MYNAISILRKDEHFNATVAQRYKCQICDKLLCITYQTPCGCRICRSCGEEYFREEKPCPVKDLECNDRIRQEDLSMDRAYDREILKLMVSCVYDPCAERYDIQGMGSHFLICEHRPVTCAKCGEITTAANLTHHEKSNCMERIVKCEYCTGEKTARILKLEHHNVESEQLCAHYKGKCPNKCDEKECILLKMHLQICPMKKMECPYEGCSQPPMNNDEMLSHFREKELDHVLLQVKRNNLVMSAIQDMKEQIEAIKEIFKEMKTSVEATTKSFIRLETSYDEMKRKIAANIAPPNLLSVIPINGNPYIWRITDYQTKWENARNDSVRSITSDPFFTHPYGYKMCIRVYPNGDGIGMNTHMSVYFALMKSDYDQLLQWPFQRSIKITIMRPEDEDPGQHELFRAGRGVGYERPTSECSIGQGAPRFITQEHLRNIYLREDSIFLQILVKD